jgi:hypothetical protein
MGKVFKGAFALLALVAIALGAWRWVTRSDSELATLVEQAPQRVREALGASPASPPAPTDVATPPADAPLQYPVPTDPYTALPMLEASDEAFVAALGEAVAEPTFTQFVETQGLIRRLVVAIDNLPNGRLSMKQRPLKAVAGALAVTGDESTLTLSADNYARYGPLVALAERVDPAALAGVYRHYYPLFQQAYQELGYPDAYFNDRLVAVIDHLLAASPVDGPVRLVQPHVLYRYADPALEARSPGHKILLRMGPENSRRVQAVLRSWRAQILAQ